MRKLTLGVIALAASAMIGSTASQATFTVDVFPNQTAAATNLNLFTGGAPGPGLEFTVNAINFASPPGNNTVGGFIGSCGAACGVAGLSATAAITGLQNTVLRFTDASAIAPGGALSAIPAQNLLAVPVSPSTVAIRHDDGVILANGIQLGTIPAPDARIISSAFATSEILNTAAFAGAQPITLLYGECCTLPAVLQTNLVNNIPEPASLALLGSALVGFGVMRRRRKTS